MATWLQPPPTPLSCCRDRWSGGGSGHRGPGRALGTQREAEDWPQGLHLGTTQVGRARLWGLHGGFARTVPRGGQATGFQPPPRASWAALGLGHAWRAPSLGQSWSPTPSPRLAPASGSPQQDPPRGTDPVPPPGDPRKQGHKHLQGPRHTQLSAHISIPKTSMWPPTCSGGGAVSVGCVPAGQNCLCFSPHKGAGLSPQHHPSPRG